MVRDVETTIMMTRKFRTFVWARRWPLARNKLNCSRSGSVNLLRRWFELSRYEKETRKLFLWVASVFLSILMSFHLLFIGSGSALLCWFAITRMFFFLQRISSFVAFSFGFLSSHFIGKALAELLTTRAKKLRCNYSSSSCTRSLDAIRSKCGSVVKCLTGLRRSSRRRLARGLCQRHPLRSVVYERSTALTASMLSMSTMEALTRMAMIRAVILAFDSKFVAF